ncbi:MAG: hypothetical protein IJ183_04970 [Prevotella sp.]|nr:hypothetical protein [Prevotella sp.]
MLKRFFLLLIVAMLNVVALWATPELNIGSYTQSQKAGETKFQEPTITVTDGGEVITNQYRFSYTIYASDGTTEGGASTKTNGVEIITDSATGTYVESHYGDVIMGGAGTVYIGVTATHKTNSTTLSEKYEINISALSATLQLTPSFAETIDPAHDGSVTLTTAKVATYDQYYLSEASTLLPEYKITSTTAGGATIDITDRFDVSIVYLGTDKVTYDSTAGKLTYAGLGNQYSGRNEDVVDAEVSSLASATGTLTYTFTPKTAYTGHYSTITKTIDVAINANTTGSKSTLHLDLERSHFYQETVNNSNTSTDKVAGTDDEYTIHVYKYGTSDVPGNNDHYKYLSPIPSILTDGGSQIPSYSKTRAWGDFKLIYEIVKDSTYYDNCDYLPFWNEESAVSQPAGEPTGLTITDYAYQVAKPGLVKVAVYAALDGTYDDEGYGAALKSMYEPYKEDGVTPKTIVQNYATYTAYSEPVYFYIDVMKRQPSIVMDPDPQSVTFVTGDVITMQTRFDISAHIGDEHNGIEGNLEFGANEGGETDHFAYQFFISERNANGHITIGGWTKDDDWEEKGGDKFSYKAMHVVPEYGTDEYSLKEMYQIAVDDSILVKTGEKLADGTDATRDTWVKITDSNLDFYKTGEGNHQYLVGGQDYEPGVMYNSMKGYGNENWTLTFLSAGDYNIPYIARPWNHTRWDNSKEMVIPFKARTTIPTKLKLSYRFTVADNCQGGFNKPTVQVVIPDYNDYDVTSDFTITYSMTGTEGEEADYTYNSTTKIYTHNVTGTTLNGETGEVTIGSDDTGDVQINVHAVRKSLTTNWTNPSDETYTIRIVGCYDRATWEVISSCSHSCVLPDTHDRFVAPDSDNRFDDITEANGRMHFLTVGDIYGGTLITGVPGIQCTIGAAATDEHATADWRTAAADAETISTYKVKKCCHHEDNSVVVIGTAALTMDEDGIPTAGSFYKFEPTVNGFLTVDGRYYANNTVVLITRDANGICYTEPFKPAEEFIGDHTFATPLIAGETYYLYDVTSGGELRMHGFSYKPAFIHDRSTTEAESDEPILGTTFLNSLSRGLPYLYNGSNSNVTFEIIDAHSVGVTPLSNYVTVDSEGNLTAHAMTKNESGIFKLQVKATVSSTDTSLDGTCDVKTTVYDIQVLDIPTYIINTPTKTEYDALDIQPLKEVTTTNISSAITMTFGGWRNESGGNSYNSGKSDTWSLKNKETDGNIRAADRIGSELADDSPTYNKTIDNFLYFTAGDQNPVDEQNKGALQATTRKEGEVYVPNIPNNSSYYSYGSGTDYEEVEDYYYNTTYRLPCRGAFLKFEPRESGTLLVYLVQNGSCDYHTGLDTSEKIGNSYQVKWRPLYITDETGKPVTMVNSFGNISDYLLTGEDALNAGSFTLGISRCDKEVDAIENAWDASTGKKYVGCSFDWSEFRGTDDDRARLMAAWPAKGERQSIIRLSNGGFALPHKAYVRYSFDVKAGKTYFVFQPGSKFEFGGFSFVPTGFPDECKYHINSTPASIRYNASNQEKNWSGSAGNVSDLTFTWENATNFNATKENLNIDINDRRKSELTNVSYSNRGELQARNFTADTWEGVCLPFSVSEQEAKRVFGDNYMVLTCDGVTADKKLHFVRHAHQFIEAGRPYLIKPSKNGTFSFQNVTVEGGETITSLSGSTKRVTDLSRFNVDVNDGEFIFKGTYMRETLPQYSYFAKNDGLYRSTTPTASAKIGGYRAYFQLQEDSQEPALSQNALAIEFEDFTPDAVESGEATGVIIVNTKNGGIKTVRKSDAIYTVNGQKYSDNPLDLNNAPSGVYIIGGHTIVK